MTPPNVALVPSSYAPHIGGVETLSRLLASELRRRGSDSFVVTSRVPVTLPAKETIAGVPVYRERFRFPERKPRHMAGFIVGTVATRQSVERAIRAHSSEVVHVHCVSSNAYYARRAARALELPLVVTLHGELTMDAGEAFQRSSKLRREWRALLNSADVVTGCSQQVIDEAIDVYGIGISDKTRVIRNGIDLTAVRAALPERRDRPYLFAIGRLVPQKGFDLLLDAFSAVSGEYPDLDLVLAGDGPERGLLEERASSRVRFLGSVAPERAYSLYAGAHAFILPSRLEPQGIVVMEAMAAGTPVLATRVGGVPETVRDGINGLLVEGGDATALADGIRRLLGDRDAASARVAQAARDVESNKWSVVADEYEVCYSDALAAHRG